MSNLTDFLPGAMGKATQAQAEAGTANNLVMTPLTTAQAIAKLSEKRPQVVSATKTDTFTLSAAISWVDIPGLSVTISPTRADSRVLLFASLNASHNFEGQPVFFRLLRGSTPIGVGNPDGVAPQVSATAVYPNNTYMDSASVVLVDHPGSTSAVTYKAQMFLVNAGGHINRTGQSGVSTSTARAASTITAMEVRV